MGIGGGLEGGVGVAIDLANQLEAPVERGAQAAAARTAARSPHRRRSRGEDRGAVLLEFALVMPLLAMLVFGILDFGFMVNRDTLVNNATRDGAREGTLNPVSADIEAVVRSELNDLDQSALTVTVTCRKPDDTACATFDIDAEPGGVVIVDVVFVHPWITFMPSLIGMHDSIDLHKTVEMRIE
jgi:Flp pilus assembly protein TadG